jgi:two-component system alkaline phosphatase synthesis response regulator PhoP
MKEKILVIEDEQKIADAIAYALKREGYLVEIIYHGDEAINKLQEFKPDAIILDVMLPGMTVWVCLL